MIKPTLRHARPRRAVGVSTWLLRAMAIVLGMVALALAMYAGFGFGSQDDYRSFADAEVTPGVSLQPSVIGPITATSGANDDYSVEIPIISIPMCAPERISAEAIGLNAPVYTMTSADINADGNADPEFFDAVAWDSEVGSAPGTDATNTSYLYGHTSYGEAVFNHLKELELGDVVTITTCNGTLQYEVEDVYTILKPDLTSDARFIEAQPGRVNVVTCYRPRGDEPVTTDNIVVQLAPLST